MATTPKGIYYPNNYNEIADIPEDMKKMAESIEEVFENTDSDLSGIKEEQTTQNNRLNSLEVDNTTNKSDILTNTQEINNIKQEQTEQNTNITNNATNIESLQEENENLKKIVSQLPQVTGQGTSITLENTIEAQFTKFDEEGNSVQDGTPSPDNEVPILSSGDNENLFDTSLLPITKNGVTISKDSKGNVVLNGTPTITSGYINFIVSSKKQLSAGTYTASFEQKKVGIGSVIVGWGNAYLNLTLDETINKKTATINDNGEAQFNINVRYDVGTLDNFILNPKLEKGNKATPYSPYGMGSINEKIKNKNWLPNNVVNQTKNGVTLVKNNDGTITANGTATAQIEILISSVKLSAGNYLGIIGVTGSTSTYYVRIGEGTTSQSPFIANIGTGDNAFSLTESKTIGAVLIIRSGQTLNNVIFKPMIRLASIIDNSYVSHEEQDYSIFVQQPMRSIGDVRDKFEQVNGVLNEKHIVYRYKLIKGTITDFNTTYNRLTLLFTGVNVNSGAIAGLSNVAKVLTNVSVNTTYTNSIVLRQRDNGGVYIYCWLDGITSRELAENYLDNNDVYVDFPIATPTYLPCTPEQVEQLENKPSTYKDFTIIQSEDETPAYLEVSGIYDMNKLITRVEVIESEV